MFSSKIGHKIKHRLAPNDNFYTPEALAIKLIPMVKLKTGQVVLDPALGTGSFYGNFPRFVKAKYCDKDKDFLMWDTPVDWLITNPPYSCLDKWLEKSFQVCTVGCAYLLGLHNITPRRVEMANRAGFGLSAIHLCKVFEWMGISAFVIFIKGKENCLSYDRVIWRCQRTGEREK